MNRPVTVTLTAALAVAASWPTLVAAAAPAHAVHEVMADRAIAPTPAAVAAPAAPAAPVWRLQGIPSPTGSALTELEGVSCPTATICYAVGSASGMPLLEAWDGTVWTITPVPTPATTPGYLYAIRCSSVTACTAVGDYVNGASTVVPLVDAWNGHAWTFQSAPSSAKAKTSTLFGVACTSKRACTAIGDYKNGAGVSLPFAEGWAGTAWKLEVVPSPSGATGTQLNSVDCTSATTCIAVGSFDTASGQMQALSELWNGRTWVVLPAVNPPGAGGAALQSVRCGATKNCTAVGSQLNSGGSNLTLAEVWDGTKWAVEPSPSPKGASASFLEGVKCGSSTSCEAVGYYQMGTTTSTLAEAWNGHHWSIQPTPDEPGASSSALYSVGCSSALSCSAVAAYVKGQVTYALAERYSNSPSRLTTSASSNRR